MYSNGILVISNDDGLCVASRNMPWKSKSYILILFVFLLIAFWQNRIYFDTLLIYFTHFCSIADCW